MKRLYPLISLFCLLSLPAWGQGYCPKNACSNFKGKEIYIPKDLQKMDLQDSTSLWSYHRMCCTDNFSGKKDLETIWPILLSWKEKK